MRHTQSGGKSNCHEGNTEKENNGYVVFKWNVLGSAWKYGGGDALPYARPHPFLQQARICKRLRSPGIDSKKSIPPAYVAWRVGTITLFVVPARQATKAEGIDSWALS